MTRKAIVKAPAKPGPPNLPQHNLPEPFATLQTLGFDPDILQYIDIEENTSEEEVPAVISRLADMALDKTYYSYGDPNDPDADVRCFTPLQAVRAMCYFCEDAMFVVPRMIPLFATDDDNLGEELPELYASIGPGVMDTLIQLMLDQAEDTFIREGASSSLVEVAEVHEDHLERVRTAIEQALDECKDDELCGYFILNLMDLGSPESLSTIERAFEQERVDLEVVVIADVIEHFNTIADMVHEIPKNPQLVYLIDGEDEDEEYQQPYIAPEKVGRNDPCPCGSGKKYKKCCGG